MRAGPFDAFGVREVAHEDVVRKLAVLESERVAERRRPLVLPGTRVHVERDEAGWLAIQGHREVLGVLMPGLLRLVGSEGQVEQLRREVEDRLTHRVVLEIRAHLTWIEAEALVLRPR